MTRSTRKSFYIILALIPILFLVVLESGLRLFHYGGNTDLFVSTPDANSPYYGINLNVGKRFFSSTSFIPSPRKDLFLKKKPSNGFRIFVLGESSAAGFPYGNNLTFSRILNRRLSDAFPDRRIEVVNTALTAISSYAMLDFMDEIIRQKPDALLIYAGHNEFYGALGVGSMESLGKNNRIVRFYLKLRNYKTFQLVRNTVVWLKGIIGGSSKSDPADDPMQTVMSRIAKDKTIPLGGKLYETGRNQFRENLRSILQKAKDAEIPVVISELVSNIRDQKPFVSIEVDTLPAAQTVFEKARLLEKEANYPGAREAYSRAKDLDGLRFRASEEFNSVIHNLAGSFAVPVVSMKSVFESASPNGLVGNGLFHEHLHPNRDGYFIMADAFFNTMRQNRFIEENWNRRIVLPDSFYKSHWGFTRLDSAYAALTIRHLKGGWPFQSGGPNLALDRFAPASLEDSIALRILKSGELTLETGHIELAGYYEKRSDDERAFREYEALIYTVPNLDLFYEPALKLLLKTEQYERALNLMQDALKFNDSGFVNKWVGQLVLAHGETAKGILFLEKARGIDPSDIQVVYNLTRAYYNTSQIDKGDAMLSILKRMAPRLPAIGDLEALRSLKTRPN